MADVRGRSCKRSRLWDRERGRQHLAAQVQSGLTVRAYCLAHGLKEWSFYNWRRRLALEPQVAGEAGMAPEFLSGPVFAEVRLGGATLSPATPSVEVMPRGERRLRVGPVFDEDTLVRVVLVLEALPC